MWYMSPQASLPPGSQPSLQAVSIGSQLILSNIPPHVLLPLSVLLAFKGFGPEHVGEAIGGAALTNVTGGTPEACGVSCLQRADCIAFSWDGHVCILNGWSPLYTVRRLWHNSSRKDSMPRPQAFCFVTLTTIGYGLRWAVGSMLCYTSCVVILTINSCSLRWVAKSVLRHDTWCWLQLSRSTNRGLLHRWW